MGCRYSVRVNEFTAPVPRRYLVYTKVQSVSAVLDFRVRCLKRKGYRTHDYELLRYVIQDTGYRIQGASLRGRLPPPATLGHMEELNKCK